MDNLRAHIAALCALVLLAVFMPSAAADAAPCTRTAAPGAPDAFDKLVKSLRPGETGCLRGGVYRENVDVTAHGAPGAPITAQSYPGEWATFLGRLTTDQTSAYVTFQNMTFDGSAAPSDGNELKPSPTVHGESISFIGNEVTNRHTAICFAVGNEDFGRAPHVVIKRNRIHDCGQLPPTNHQHGIYLHSPCCAQVTDNWIYDNADTGVNLFPDADGNYIARNVMYGNGDNLSFAGRSKNGVCSSSDDNIVERNVMSHPRVRDNITSWTPCGKHGSGNVLRQNCIWPATFEGPEGYSLVGNLYVEPQYVNAAAKDFRIVPGTPCAPLVVDTGAPPPARRTGSRKARALVMRRGRRTVRVGGRLVLSGRLRANASGTQRVRIDVRRGNRWLRVCSARLTSTGRFRVVLRLRLKADPPRKLLLGAAKLAPTVRRLQLRAQVAGVGRSAVVLVRVRR
jgi:hypothetical protein